MKLAELRATKPSTNVVAALNYLCDLSSETGVPIEGWDLYAVFGTELTNAPRELNKKFFAHAKRVERVAKSTLTPEQIKIIESGSRRFRPGEASTLERSIEDRKSKIRQSQHSIVSYGREIGDMRVRLEALAGNKESLVAVAQEILNSGFWTLEESTEDSYFVLNFLSDEVIMTHPQPDGRDFKVNLGRIRVGLTSEGNVTAMGRDHQRHAKIHAGRMGRGPYFHPYINYDGSICYGNAAPVVADLLGKRLYADVFVVTQSLLTTYSPDNPYCNIETFFLEGVEKETALRAPWLKKLTPEMKEKYGLNADGTLGELVIVHDLECSECQHTWAWERSTTVDSDTYQECPECGHDNYVPDATVDERRERR